MKKFSIAIVTIMLTLPAFATDFQMAEIIPDGIVPATLVQPKPMPFALEVTYVHKCHYRNPQLVLVDVPSFDDGLNPIPVAVGVLVDVSGRPCRAADRPLTLTEVLEGTPRRGSKFLPIGK